VRHFGQGNDVALVIGGSIPLGGKQHGRGNVERARAERLAAEAELAVVRVERKREIDRLLAQRAAIVTEIGRIDREVLPSAERAVVLVRDGFNRGGTAFTFLEVAQAQQVVIDARTRRIDLLHRYHLDGVRLDRLAGRHASLIASAENR
jgi:cobalt-zinc-cadmium efflux system outer membrane protein